jgi:uncharacterized protein YbjT (DUF2867 family)
MTRRLDDMKRLEGKIALVTGGHSGIGLATAKRFVNEGAYVFITGRREAELADAVHQIGTNVSGVRGDVANAGDLDRLFAHIEHEKGTLSGGGMHHPHPILVTGAAGRVGAIGPVVTKALLDRGFKVRAMVRREDERSMALRSLGAEVVVGNLLDLHDAHRVLEGCRRVYFSMSVDSTYLEATTNMAAVCKHHGVDAFVNMSQMTVSQMSIHETTDSPQHKQHWLAEQVLRWSGLPVVYMRPTAFMEVFFLQLCSPTIRRNGVIMLPFGSGKTSPIAAVDVGRCVTAVLADPAPHIGKIYELTGPSSDTLAQVAEQYASALGRKISYVDVPVEPWEEELRQSGMSSHVTAHLITMAAMHRQNRYDRHTDDVEKLTGSPPMSIADFVRMHAAEFEAGTEPCMTAR